MNKKFEKSNSAKKSFCILKKIIIPRRSIFFAHFKSFILYLKKKHYFQNIALTYVVGVWP